MKPDRLKNALSARDAACRAITEALAGGEFVSDQIRRLRSAGRLDAREAGLASEIGLGAVRHAITIRQVLSSVARYDDRRVKPELRAILYASAYQLLWLDRVPEFAIVDEAVTMARRVAGAGASGMVNAVLRILTRAIENRRVKWERECPSHVRIDWDGACAFSTVVLPPPETPASPLSHMAAATSERPERYRDLVERFGRRRAEAASWASQATPATVLHRNPLRVDSAKFRELVAIAIQRSGETTTATFHIDADTAWLRPSVGLIDSALHADGLTHIQDTTAHAAVALLAARPGERILDLCAAPGGKSIVLAQHMQDQGEVIACDVSAARLKLVADNAARMKLSCIRPHSLNADGPPGGAGAFDAALVDAPCSNSGVIARRPEARFRLTAANLRSLASSQAQLLRRAAAVVHPGGRLVYSTCSIEPAENEEIVAAFARESPEWRLQTSELTLPAWGPSPGDWRDGGFAALFIRV